MLEKLRHGAGFVTSGLLAFLTDAAVLTVLTRYAGIDPFLARLAAIAVAMVAGYFAHRRLTFRVQEAPSLAQFGKFFSVAATASIINYTIYAGILMAYPGWEPLAALVIATIVSMIASYAGLRFGVFKKTTPKP